MLPAGILLVWGNDIRRRPDALPHPPVDQSGQCEPEGGVMGWRN